MSGRMTSNMNHASGHPMSHMHGQPANCGSGRTMNRRQLMDHINQVSFAVDDVQLYLDTHPCDHVALDYFHEMSRRRSRALKEYAETYGPLTIDTADYSCAERWNWINEPWPWQEGGC